MIQTDEQLLTAQQAIQNIQKFLLRARKVHTPKEYRAMSELFLLEIQQREQAIISYLQSAEEQAVAV
jgi:hypothetical protein